MLNAIHEEESARSRNSPTKYNPQSSQRSNEQSNEVQSPYQQQRGSNINIKSFMLKHIMTMQPVKDRLRSRMQPLQSPLKSPLKSPSKISIRNDSSRELTPMNYRKSASNFATSPSFSRQQKMQRVMSQEVHEEEDDDIFDPKSLYDCPMLDFNEYQSPWKTLFLSLISPHANKYQGYMINKLKDIKKKSQVKKSTSILRKESSGNTNYLIGSPLKSLSLTRQTTQPYKDQEKGAPEKKESNNNIDPSGIQKFSLQINPTKRSSSIILNKFKSSEANSAAIDKVRKLPSSSISQNTLNFQNLQKLNERSGSLKRMDSLVSNGNQSKRGSNRSHFSRRSSRYSSKGTMNEKKIRMMIKNGKLIDKFQANLRKRSGFKVIENPIIKSVAPKNLTEWKKEIFNHQILNGTMSNKATLYLQQQLRTHRIDRSLQFQNGQVVNREKYKGLFRQKKDNLFQVQSNNHLRLALDSKKDLTNLQKFDIITELWDIMEEQELKKKFD
ncbi:UNKNOWN [Stylonychia lemnae]|uniref:Uncharacterized protein n=1 Tax=Stylonychia lemnae TaxID=5949 RepID=A0A078AME3_STYLE|nr:UNKNOWN [Stylonychia lemnae]|eukprot:CDW82023.1 UNKNOWN [Stylonychia lemnae]